MPEISPRPWEHPQLNPEVAPQSEVPAKVEQSGVEVVPQPAGPQVVTPVPLPAVPLEAPRPQFTREVESVLEEGLSEFYHQLNPQEQAEFKRRGEETASKVAVLLMGVRVKVQQVLKLIREWLKTIPGVNRYFVEQEAKLKADKLLKLPR